MTRDALRRRRHRQRHRRRDRPCRRAFLRPGLEKGAMTPDRRRRAADLYGRMGTAIEMSGGSAANTIAGIASFGGKAPISARSATTSWAGCSAHDIRAIGVEFDSAPLTDGAPTARCLILVTPDAQRTMNTFLGASVDSARTTSTRPRSQSAHHVSRGLPVGRPPAKGAFRRRRSSPMPPAASWR